jgi:hypothetical protein
VRTGFPKDILAAIFERKGGRGPRTTLFRSGALNEKCEQLGREFGLDKKDEEAVLFITDELGEPLIFVTTKRLFWNSEGKMHWVSLLSIAWQEPADRTEHKKLWTRLRVTTFEGDPFVIRSEPGDSFFGLWNVLLYVSRSNRRHRPSAVVAPPRMEP